MAEQERAEITETFAARRLQVGDIPGTVQVRVGQTARMQVRVAGIWKLVERMRYEVRGDTLHLSGPRSGGGSGTTVFSRSHGGISVVSSNVVHTAGGAVASRSNVVVVDGHVVGGGEDVAILGCDGEVRVVVDVPHRAPITIDGGTFGSYEIGDIEGPLDVRMRGAGRLTAGRMAATRVSIQGAGDVEIAAVNGSALNVAIRGSGDVVVREGEVDSLEMSVEGSANTVYGGTARSANLSIIGSGDIRVNQVTESLNDRCMGSGRIRVHRPPHPDAGSSWS